MTDIISDLKNVKIPLWARALGWWRARQRRKAALREFKYVATITHYALFKKRIVESWYVLKERGDGKRIYEYKTGNNFWTKEDQTWVYVHIVEPWCLGKYSHSVIAEWASKQKVPSLED